MPEPVDTCAVCPRLCRHACPVAEGTAREAAVPANLARMVRAWRDGHADDALAAEAAGLCTDCGACTEACHLHIDLPTALAAARARLGTAPTPEPLAPLQGQGAYVALVEAVEDWSALLATQLGEPVARWTSGDHLGWGGRGHAGWDAHLKAIASCVGDRTVVTTTAPASRALQAAGVAHRSLAELLEHETASGCGRGASCCGAHGPLAAHHPSDAARLASRFALDAPLADTACSAHLRAHGREGVVDVVEVLRSTLEAS